MALNFQRIYLVKYVFLCVMTVLSSTLRGARDTKFPMYSDLIGI
ncbi:MATE family efflux transporter [Peptoclostridium litorale]